MPKRLCVLLPPPLLLLLACGGSAGEFPARNGDGYLSFDGHQTEIKSVFCSERMGRVTVRFKEGALYVSKRDEPPGYEAVLRLTSPERRKYVNREMARTSSDLVRTMGLSLYLDRGVHGEIRMMRSMSLLNPDHFPDAVPITMQVRAACPK